MKYPVPRGAPVLRRGPLRDALVLLAAFALVLGGLCAYAGTWPPAVVVESGSMMHPDNEVGFGRLGTIDPGDLVLVKRVSGPDDVGTMLEGARGSYGKAGDVLIYRSPGSRTGVPIIHRAVAYVDVRTDAAGARSYWVRWSPDAPCEGNATKAQDAGRSWCVFGSAGIRVPSVPIGIARPYQPQVSGFITKGDHNTIPDPEGLISVDAQGHPSPALPAWIEGKARGELPWLGLVKLALAGRPNQANPPADWVKVGSAYAPRDLWIMLALSLVVLVGVPLGWDAWRALQRRRTSTEPVPEGGAKPQERDPPPET